MILGVHDLRNWLTTVDDAGTWAEGARHPGITIYNDPPEITFRKNDSESRKDMVVTFKDGNWIADFYRDEELVHTVVI